MATESKIESKTEAEHHPLERIECTHNKRNCECKMLMFITKDQNLELKYLIDRVSEAKFFLNVVEHKALINPSSKSSLQEEINESKKIGREVRM